jgi:hypothetical protein
MREREMGEGGRIESEILSIVNQNRRAGRVIPTDISSITGLPFSDYSTLLAQILAGQVLLQRFSFEYVRRVYDILASPIEACLLSLYSVWCPMIAVFVIIALSVTVGALQSWWWLLLLLLIPYCIRMFLGRAKNIYNHVILRSATQSELAFCFLYVARQVSIVDTETRETYYWTDAEDSNSRSSQREEADS